MSEIPLPDLIPCEPSEIFKLRDGGTHRYIVVGPSEKAGKTTFVVSLFLSGLLDIQDEDRIVVFSPTAVVNAPYKSLKRRYPNVMFEEQYTNNKLKEYVAYARVKKRMRMRLKKYVPHTYLIIDDCQSYNDFVSDKTNGKVLSALFSMGRQDNVHSFVIINSYDMIHHRARGNAGLIVMANSGRQYVTTLHQMVQWNDHTVFHDMLQEKVWDKEFRPYIYNGRNHYSGLNQRFPTYREMRKLAEENQLATSKAPAAIIKADSEITERAHADVALEQARPIEAVADGAVGPEPEDLPLMKPGDSPPELDDEDEEPSSESESDSDDSEMEPALIRRLRREIQASEKAIAALRPPQTE